MESKVSSLAIALVACILLGAMVPCLSEDVDAEYHLTVTDGMGHIYDLDRIPSKIVTIGSGLTATAIELDLLDRMIVCDRYSVLDNHELFNDLRNKVNNDEIRANGSAYSTGLESIKIDIWTMTEEFDLAEGKDVYDVAIFITGLPTSLNFLYEDLTNSRYNYKYVFCWDDIDSYDSLVDLVRTMSLVMKGEVDEHVTQMTEIPTFIDTILSATPDLKVRDAFYVTYSGGELKVGNEGSLANSMISAAGGHSITTDTSKAKTYAINIPRLLEDHGSDVVIFVDNVLASNESNMDVLRKALGGRDVTLVRLDPLWNNYCVESMNGVWAMACAMYPDHFEGEVPFMDNDYEEDTGMYIIAGSVGAAMIAVLAFLYFKT